MKRAIVQKNGTSGNGKLIFVGESLEMFLHEANRVLNMLGTTVYTEKGGVVEDIRVIRDDEVLYVSEGEMFMDPKYAVATRPLVNKCNADEANMSVDQNDWVSLNVGGKRFTTTSSLNSNLATSGTSVVTGSSISTTGSSVATCSSLGTGSSTGSTMKVTPHMSEIERNILMALVNQYRDVIESRRNDSSAVQRKGIAWDYVEKEYNTQPMVRNQRTKKQLRKAYENLKMRSKKDIMKKQKLSKPQEQSRQIPTETNANMQVMMTESEIPAEIRTLLNPYDVEDTTYHNEAPASIHDDSLSGTEEQGDVGSFEYPRLHHSRHGSTAQEQFVESQPDSVKSDGMQNESRSTKSDSIHNECKPMEITTKPLTKMFTSGSAIPVSNIPQVQMVAPVATGDHDPSSAVNEGENLWRKDIYHSGNIPNTYNEYEDVREEKYQPDLETVKESTTTTTINKSCYQGNADIDAIEPKFEKQHHTEKQTVRQESYIQTPSHQEMEILILQTKLENERREHKIRIQVLRQQLKYWKKKTMNQK